VRDAARGHHGAHGGPRARNAAGDRRPETAAGDWSWIRGGKSQSEWLWDNILYDVPFRSGYNTETYRHYISFDERFRTG
jgi:hypothetical protein